MSFTHIKDVDLKILQELEDSDFESICRVNKYVNKLCGEESFWLNRFLLKNDFDLEDIKNMKGNFTYRELYKHLYINKKAKDILIESAKTDNLYLYKELIWKNEGKELVIKAAAENGSLNILTYVFINEQTPELKFLVSLFGNIKTVKWLKVMEQIDYDAYLINLVTREEEVFAEIGKYLDRVDIAYHPELYYELGKSLSKFPLETRIKILDIFLSKKLQGVERAIEGAYEVLKTGDKLNKWLKYVKMKIE